VTTTSTGTSLVVTTASNKTITFTKNKNEDTFSITTAYTIQEAEESQTVEDLLDVFESFTIEYNNSTYTIDVPELVTIRNYIDNAAVKAATWAAINTVQTRQYDDSELTITPVAGDATTKIVTFTDGPFEGKTYTVTVTGTLTQATVTISNNSITATISKSANSIEVTLN
jgi:hypothetical protein